MKLVCAASTSSFINWAHHEGLAAAAAKSLQSCPTLCDPTDGSPLLALLSYHYGAELPRRSTSFPSSHRVYAVCTLHSQRIFCKSLGYFLYTTQPVHNQCPHTCHPDCQNVISQNTLTGHGLMKEQDLYLPCRKCFKTDKEE